MNFVKKQFLTLMFFLTMIIGPANAVSQEYSFEIPEEEEPSLQFNGNLDVKWAFLQSRNESPIYRFQFSEYSDMENYLSQYRLDYYFNSEYRNKKLFFRMKTYTQYSKNDPLDIFLYELYGSLNLSPKLSMGIGKKRFIWGKGYAFNPVGYVNTEKDPENPDLALAGKSMVFLNYNKSYDSNTLRNFSFSGIVLPPEPEYNEKFGNAKNTEYAAKLYFLVKNVDIDFMMFNGKNNMSRYGFDFSTNIKSNLEIHGEWSYNLNQLKNSIYDNDITSELYDGASYLVGLRYLNKFNTTFILEYYFNGGGLSEFQYGDFLSYLRNALETDDQIVINNAKRNMTLISHSKTLMKEYLYFNIKHPEPFSLVYSSFSVFLIYNLADKSLLISPRLNYSPFTNFELMIWPSFTSGKTNSEFGNKMFSKKFEVWFRYFY